MLRNRCQCNILQIFEENYFHLLSANFKFLQDAMFHSKINQVILVAILLFLDLRSVLQMIFIVTFYVL